MKNKNILIYIFLIIISIILGIFIYNRVNLKENNTPPSQEENNNANENGASTIIESIQNELNRLDEKYTYSYAKTENQKYIYEIINKDTKEVVGTLEYDIETNTATSQFKYTSKPIEVSPATP